MDDVQRFIRENLHLEPVLSVPGVRLYMAHHGSGLRRLDRPDDDDPPPPYWAYPWAGGLALARYILERPQTVAGRRVLDLGAGSGLVGIAAAKAGASEVVAAEIDRNGIAALGLNAVANGVTLVVIGEDLTVGSPPDVDLVAVGDLYYEPALAERVTGFLDRCLVAGLDVLIGDPRRAHLPHSRLRLLAEYRVPDVGEAKGTAMNASGVFSFLR